MEDKNKKDKEIIDNQKTFEVSNIEQNDLKLKPEIDIFTKEDQDEIKKVIKKQNTKYKYTKLSNFVLKMSRLYAPMPIWKISLITSLLAVFFGVISFFFVKNTGIYNFGLAAFGQSISRLTNVYLRHNPDITIWAYNIIDNLLFWILYLVLSIPIFIFGWKKVGKIFTLLTIEFLVISSLVSFGIGQIPGANDIYIIGNFNHSNISEMSKQVISNELWAGKNDLWQLIPLTWSEGGNSLAQVIYAFAYGAMLAVFFAVIAIIGGSAGVTGIIGEYMSVVKHKNFGTINGYINLIIIVISVMVGTWLPGSLLVGDLSTIDENFLTSRGVSAIVAQSDIQVINELAKLKWHTSLYFSPNLISTFISNFVFVAFLNKLFPRYKIVQCKVYSPHMSKIREVIVSDKKTINSFTISKGIGGYSGNKTKVLSAITLYKQVPRLIKNIRKVDENALITISNVSSIDGNLYLPQDKF
ncbi:DUF2179 domain-containing protein [Mycoplasma sp. Mirounga ES2805-ORL]|uniref:DUF2179 domain-containing protein n=1 Tax=Mycoplasma sp. Mirounga ES2805-ORL TaxID=754514 RepID=UPI00197C70ED|nr:DUF2179 domain-containing protein [Mycoplasma sp. Mirounga ES2805-ORL]QSF13603.1 YitT family protein [Mycoplasma sp. Mirounga ES2805-ORL]